jgi:hypothetical protein
MTEPKQTKVQSRYVGPHVKAGKNPPAPPAVPAGGQRPVSPPPPPRKK